MSPSDSLRYTFSRILRGEGAGKGGQEVMGGGGPSLGGAGEILGDHPPVACPPKRLVAANNDLGNIF